MSKILINTSVLGQQQQGPWVAVLEAIALILHCVLPYGCWEPYLGTMQPRLVRSQEELNRLIKRKMVK